MTAARVTQIRKYDTTQEAKNTPYCYTTERNNTKSMFNSCEMHNSEMTSYCHVIFQYMLNIKISILAV